jgi:hypothetical protein
MKSTRHGRRIRAILAGAIGAAEGGRTMNASARTTPNSQTQKDAKAGTSPALGSTDLAGKERLKQTVSLTGPERLRCLWWRLRLTIAEMNYATRRMAEQQMRLP